MSDAESPDWIGEQSWTNPFPEGHPVHDLFGRRIRNQQDLVIVLDDYWNRRGTGKTIASLQLAQGMDQVGPLTEQNAHIDPEPFRQAYVDMEKRRGMVLDEGEVGISNRNAMSSLNQEIRKVLSMGRVEEKYVVINAPSWNFLDKDVKGLATLWISMVTKGIGLVHEVKPHPYLNQILTPKIGLIEFEDVGTGTHLREVYHHLSRSKRDKLDGEDGGGYVSLEEHEQALENAVEEAKLESRNDVIRGVYRHPEIDTSQATLGDAVDLSQQSINNIVNG